MGRKKGKVGAITTFLGSDAEIEGTIHFRGVIRLDGKVKGRIFSDDGTVIVGERAVIEADIAVNGAVIMGEVNGSINAKERIEVLAPGKIAGDIFAPVISIDPGARFDGNCGMKRRETTVKQFSDSPAELPAPEEAGEN